MNDERFGFLSQAAAHMLQWIVRSGDLVSVQGLLDRAEQLARRYSPERMANVVKENLAGLLEQLVTDTFLKWRRESVPFYQPTAYLCFDEVEAWNGDSVVDVSRREDLFIPLIWLASLDIDYYDVAEALLIWAGRWHKPCAVQTPVVPGDDKEAEEDDATSTKQSGQKKAPRRRGG